MYTAPFNRMRDESEARAFVAAVQAGWLVTSRPGDVPAATFLPVVWRDDVVIAHLARANSHWREISDGDPALLIVTGPDAYVSPEWYEAKAETGRVVPTWNYSAVHLAGRVRIHEDAASVLAAVRELTDLHETPRPAPWSVDDAPRSFLEGQLAGVVALELQVTRVDAKAKLSQNRSASDRARITSGLQESRRFGEGIVADQMTQWERGRDHA